ncbi:hypothetical protein GRX03_04885 [Halovenus sp. WSH3]|uniref:Uncharacterized protein n=1 Tax=Halovenus carboxidivorans TaxID=2692199 RepID=A0A6B0T5V1_9EURY|nr:hypothetical protein [Halovenus carboxidivorans]MXR50943.1 hypothetical protein [Halovenus carboxidivorans]
MKTLSLGRVCSVFLCILSRENPADQFARCKVESVDDLEQPVEDALENIVTPNVESTLDEPTEFGVLINYLGAYPVWSLPTDELSAPKLDDSTTEFGQAHQLLESRGDRPPPIKEYWDSQAVDD